MTVCVKLFARTRDLAGTGELMVDLPEQARVADLRKSLAAIYPALSTILDRCAVAVDNEFAGENVVLHPNNEIALLPPVSGG